MIKLNGIEIKPTIFPDGTSQVWKIDNEAFEYESEVMDLYFMPTGVMEKLKHNSHIIEWEFENEAELFHILQLRDLLNSISSQKVLVGLHIPFLPYGRQDKVVSNENTFARNTFLKIIREAGFNKITTIDSHSKLPSYVEDVFPKDALNLSFDLCSPSLVCYPDNGAQTRYGGFFGKFPSCSFTKDRDQETGHIKNLFLNEMIDIKGEDVLIVDDICDGGMTFKLTAEKLLQCGAKSVNLYTTHGIYSKGLETLRDSGIDRIFNRKGEV